MSPPTAGRNLNRRFLRLSLPNVASNLLVPLAGLVDVALLGHWAEVQDLAGVALAIVLFDYLYWSFGFLRMGTTGLTAQALGRNDPVEILRIALRGWVIALCIGLMLVVLRVPLRELGFALLQGGEQLERSGRIYFDSRIWAAPFALTNLVFLGWFLGREQAGRALVLSAVAHGGNIVLDLLFIVALGWGAAGAGAATAASQVLMFLTAIAIVQRDLEPSQLRGVGRTLFEAAKLRSFLALGGNITVRTLLLISTFAIFTNLAATMGAVVLAATAILRNLVAIGAWFVDGFAFATESLAGIFRGERDPIASRQLLRLAMAWSLFVSGVLALIFVAMPNSVFPALTDHAEVLALLNEQAIWLLPVLILGAPAYVLDGYFLGITAGRTLSLTMLLAVLVGFVPWAWWAREAQSVHLLWMALSVFMLARTVGLGLRVPSTLAEISS